ncbi:unnamed protein product [Cyclocybe aegerita]|uniref:Uncharacterized protein n=1 Tax=Cyclocybe aegerita TaxID=1973307 RepID=A0A8S0X9F6_CYCAE|nr:unnamed protein product [Cyclocybe aegerita]
MSDSSPRRKLPEWCRKALWHSTSGLVVCSSDRSLPLEAAGDETEDLDFTKPRKVSDDNIYLAFVLVQHYGCGELFSAIQLLGPHLSAAIEPIPFTDPPRYALKSEYMDAWIDLENALLTICYELLDKHTQSHQFPKMSYPMWPYQYGYREGHDSRDLAVTACRNSRNAFQVLAGYATFTFSLWLGKYEATCFDDAFVYLAGMDTQPFPQSYLTLLRHTVVCNLAPYLHAGCFLNPYTTKWAPFLKCFTRANTPVWLLWGHDYNKTKTVDPYMQKYYLPPNHIVDLARSEASALAEETKRRAAAFASIPAPTRDAPLPHFATAFSGDEDGLQEPQYSTAPASVNPIDRTLIVDRRSRQLRGENWSAFFRRMEDALETRRREETPEERGRREGIEKQALQNGYTAKTPIFLWEQDEVDTTFWRRTLLPKAKIEINWGNYSKFQRKFWSHIREWDLCPQLPRFPEGVNPRDFETPVEEIDDVEDERYNFLYSKPTVPPKKPQDKHTENFASRLLASVRTAIAYDDTSDSAFSLSFHSLTAHLRIRHGFDAESEKSWTPALHDSKNATYIERGSPLRRLQYESYPNLVPGQNQKEVRVSILDFYDTAIAVKEKETSYRDLPDSWDIARSLKIKFFSVQLQRVKCHLPDFKEIFILRPAGRSKATSSWFVAIPEATVVLLVYRSGWATMREIAQGLLGLGVRFYTVLEAKKKPEEERSWEMIPLGLGSRPNDFHPSQEDYLSYLAARDQVLRSRYGRAIRLAGGIAGRIATEVVPDVEVLDGPIVGDALIGSHGDSFFVDDTVGEDVLDIVSGVYYVQKAQGSGRPSQQSWWPKQNSWQRMGFSEVQWQPDAEAFYQKRQTALRNGEYTLRKATDWREKFKYDRKFTARLHEGSEALAREFLRHSSRVG